MEPGHETAEDADYSTGSLFGEVDQSVNEEAVIDGLKISVLEKSGLALTLIADHIFSPALVLSELIYQDVLDVKEKRVLELGCGTGLAGLVALKHGAAAVCLTDYDDESILRCPRLNLSQNNEVLPQGRCTVEGHTWGTDASSLLRGGKYDRVILADILWYIASHKDILHSVDQTLSEDGEVWVSSGKYTTCAADFFALAGNSWTHDVIELSDEWTMPLVTGISNLSDRKRNCLCWKLQRQILK